MESGAQRNVNRKTGTMKAAVVAAPKRVELQNAPLPIPTATQVRIRVEGCGVCGSNLPTWQGREWFKYPLAPGAPGHEGWGVIDEIGADVRGLRPGQRVAFLSGNAFAEFDVTDQSNVVVLPETLNTKPFPGEPLGCAMNIYRRSDIHAGQTVAIVGIGFLGAILTRLATNAGARVIAITRRPAALEVAKEFGAAELIPMDDHNRIINRVKDLTNGTFCDRVIEVVGEQWPLDLAGELTPERGRLMIAGYHQDGPRQVNMWLWNWRGLDVINAHERDPKVYLEGIRMAVDAVASGHLEPSPLYTHSVPLDRANDAFDLLQNRPDGFMKALVTV